MPETHPDGALVGLLHRAVRGDSTAREELLQTLHVPLRRYAQRQLSGWVEPEEVAKDIAQDALVRITGNLQACYARSDAQLLAWALAITRNILIDRVREHTAEDLARIGPVSEPVAAEPQSPPTLADRTLRRIVRSLLRSLPAERARLLQLRLELGERWGDIGAEMGTSWYAARRRFQRLQAFLRKEIVRRIEDLPPETRQEVERQFRRRP